MDDSLVWLSQAAAVSPSLSTFCTMLHNIKIVAFFSTIPVYRSPILLVLDLANGSLFWIDDIRSLKKIMPLISSIYLFFIFFHIVSKISTFLRLYIFRV